MLTPGTLMVTAVVAVVLVGSKRLRTLGEDLGAALKSFRQGLHGDPTPSTEKEVPPPPVEKNRDLP